MRVLLPALLISTAAVAAPGQVLFHDSFTAVDGGALLTHDPDFGDAGSWVQYSGAGTGVLVQDRGALAAKNTDARFENVSPLPATEYTVSALFHILSNPSNDLSIRGRADSNLGYACGFNGAGRVYFSMQGDAGTNVSLGTLTPASFNFGATHSIELILTDAEKLCVVDSTLVLSTTDNAVSGPGHVAFTLSRFGTSPTDVTVDELTATEGDGGLVLADGGALSPDGGVLVFDGGSGADGGAASDGGTSADGGASGDGGTLDDGGTLADGGMLSDGGLTDDGGLSPDGGAPGDGDGGDFGGLLPDGGQDPFYGVVGCDCSSGGGALFTFSVIALLSICGRRRRES